MKTVAFYTLGCKTNQYDTQAMREQFLREGWREAEFDGAADVYVVNSCTVTAMSDKKTRQIVSRAHRTNPEGMIVVAGCLAQRDAEAVLTWPGVGLALGNDGRLGVVDKVKQALGEAGQNMTQDIRCADSYEPLAITGTGGHTRAVVKIQEGCDRFCTYCIIPHVRGPIRSRGIEEVKAELERLAQAGCKEAVFTGIHIASWGRDLNDGTTLMDLLEAVDGILPRMRLGSLEPVLLTQEFCARAAKLQSLCHQFHVSLQSGSQGVLKRMGRRYTPQQYAQNVQNLREAMPGCAITTDVMVGFPGETAAEHAESLAFVREIAFARIHVFPYSPREGTPAAKFADQVQSGIKTMRNREMLALGEQLACGYAQTLVGREEAVLLEEAVAGKPGVYQGHTPQYVLAHVPFGQPGQIVHVCLTAAQQDYLLAQPVAGQEAAASV